MAEDKKQKRLTSVGRINRRRNLGAGETQPWWKTSRRKFIIGSTAAAAGLALAGGGIWLATRDDTTDADKDSLELQQAEGWNVGSEERPLVLPNSQDWDSQQSENWRNYLDPSAMLRAYQPKAEAWMPYFVPTLIQSLQFASLRNQLKPISMPDMQESYARGQSIARDFLANAQNAGETAIIVDVPGRDSIALGAGLAAHAHLITTFDNFPHPLGVTPSHETLAAMLYYAAEIEAKQAAAPANAPPVFLLDSHRLEAYKDADTQFDNRYLAKLPSAQKFQERGIKSIIYVTPDRTRTEELDDLNEDFVEYQNKGLNVAMLPLTDFRPYDVAPTGGQTSGSSGATSDRHYYYGGHPLSHFFFFSSYPFYRPYPAYAARVPGNTIGRTLTAPPSISAPRYVPAPRPTMFTGTRLGTSASGIGRTKPTGFGRSTVRVASSGRVVGTRAGRSGFYSPGRSGSFGRGGGYSG